MTIIVKHRKDVDIERMEEKDGWAISEFRLPITGKSGSATTVFHSIFRPGSTHAKHLHYNSDEIAVYLSGKGVVGQGTSRASVSGGYCRLMPKGSVHFFHNETKISDALVLGFYLNATSVADTGYKFCGKVNPDDLLQPREGLKEGILVHLEDAPIVKNGLPASWRQFAVHSPIGNHNGSLNSLIHLIIPPSTSTDDFQFNNAEAIYYVDSGKGCFSDIVRSYDLIHESIAFVPKGITHKIRNYGIKNLNLFLLLTGAGSLEEAN